MYYNIFEIEGKKYYFESTSLEGAELMSYYIDNNITTKVENHKLLKDKESNGN